MTSIRGEAFVDKHYDFDKNLVLYFVAVRSITVREIGDMITNDM